MALNCAHGQDLHALKACTQLRDDGARLSCYDSAMGVSKSSGTEHGPSDKEVGAEAKFGDDGRLHTEAKTTLPKNLSAQVRTVMPLPGGRYRLTLDNGQVWDTTQADSSVTFNVNDSISISRGWLGSYQVSLAGHTTSISVARKQ